MANALKIFFNLILMGLFLIGAGLSSKALLGVSDIGSQVILIFFVIGFLLAAIGSLVSVLEGLNKL